MRYPALVRAVTAPQLLHLARRYLDPDHYTLVVVGPPVTGAPPSTMGNKQ
jgi:predicted Zn-dependent peptidase